MIFIHGGGWRAGSKCRIPSFLAEAFKEGWLSVVSVEYRFSQVAIHPAQANDCIRAVQFVRSKSAEWNIDPARIGVCGGSAGAHLSLWVALHDDAAKPGSQDPVERQTSRVSCAISFAGPTDWALLGELPHRHPAYRQLLGYEPGTPAGEMEPAKKVSVSPITYVSKDDPPILLVHGDEDVIVPIRHARDLHARMTKAGASSELFVVQGGTHRVAGARGEAVVDRSTAFMKEHLLGKKDPASQSLPTVVLLGDSIRMNYQNTVTQALEGTANVWTPTDNCGHTAYTLANLDRWLEGQENVQVIHINVGLHDLYLNAKTGMPRHTLDTYEANLRGIFAKLKQLSHAKVIFALTTVVDEKRQPKSGYKRVVRRNADVDIYNAKARAIAKEFGIAVNDLNAFMKKAEPEKILTSDGIHLSPEGCKLMGAEVARVIREHLPPSQ